LSDARGCTWHAQSVHACGPTADPHGVGQDAEPTREVLARNKHTENCLFPVAVSVIATDSTPPIPSQRSRRARGGRGPPYVPTARKRRRVNACREVPHKLAGGRRGCVVPTRCSSVRRATTHASILGDTGETRRARPHATTHTALAGLAHRPLTISFNPLPPTRLLLCACTSHLNLS